MSERRLRVGLVMEPKGIDDPYNHGAYLGLERAVRELGIRGRVLTAPKEGYVPSLSLLARQHKRRCQGAHRASIPQLSGAACARSASSKSAPFRAQVSLPGSGRQGAARSAQGRGASPDRRVPEYYVVALEQLARRGIGSADV